MSGRSGVAIKAGGTVSIQGEPYVHLNPTPSSGSGAAGAEGPDHVVHFKLASEGRPLAGARAHVQHEDGTASSPQVTDANGLVRLPVDKAGTYRVKLGHPKAKDAKDAKATAATAPPVDPVTGGASVTGGTLTPIDVGSTPAQPRTKATPTEHDVPITLEIVEPKPGTTFHLLSTPAMPEIPLHAQVLVQGKPVTAGSVRWELHASGTYYVRDASGLSAYQQPYVLPVGDTRTTPGEAKRYLLAPPELVGGELEIKVIFDGGPSLGGLTATKTVKGCQLLGTDPSAVVVEAAIVELTGSMAWLYLRLFSWESGLTQFATRNANGNTIGWPLNGAPSGTGIVQRDPEAPEWVWPKSRVTSPNNFFPRIFWNWKKNLAEGISSFTSTYIERARGDLDALRAEFPHLPPYPEPVLLRAAIRRYNGGTEYVASGDGRHYLVDPAGHEKHSLRGRRAERRADRPAQVPDPCRCSRDRVALRGHRREGRGRDSTSVRCRSSSPCCTHRRSNRCH